MNSARRTGRLSHPASAAAFPFSPGGAARRPFLFFSLFLLLPPPGALPVSGPAGRGLPGRFFLPGPGAPPGRFPGRSPALPAGLPAGLQALRPAGCTPPCRPRRAAAVLPAFPAGTPFFAACPQFSAARPPFSPARAPRFPAYPLFCPQSRVQAFCPFHVVCTLRRRQGRPARPWRPAGAVSPWVPAAPAPRPAPPFSRRFFGPLYKRGKF